MAQTYMRLNDVTYQLASALSEQERKELAERLTARAGEARVDVLLPDNSSVEVELRIDLSKVWASGVGHVDSTVHVF